MVDVLSDFEASVSEQLLREVSWQRAILDEAGLAETTLVETIFPSDSVVAGDVLAVDLGYGRLAADTFVSFDVTHPWAIPQHEILETDWQGVSGVSATLIKHKASAPIGAPPARPRVKPVNPAIHYNVINPNPPRREDI